MRLKPNGGKPFDHGQDGFFNKKAIQPTCYQESKNTRNSSVAQNRKFHPGKIHCHQ
jgi:hypothetical protein